MASDRPKRKCAQVSYYEPDADDGSLGGVRPSKESKHVMTEEQSDDDFFPTKKAKAEEMRRHAVKKEEETEPFPFMSLPPEVRNMVYKNLLVERFDLRLIHGQNHRKVHRGHATRNGGAGTSIKVYDQRTKWPEGSDKTAHTRLRPAILRVSRQVYQEAMPILYGQEIQLQHPLALFNFLTDIGAANRLLLKKLVVYGWGWTEERYRSMRYPGMVLLGTATNLIRLRFGWEQEGDIPFGLVGHAHSEWWPRRYAWYFSKDVQYWVQAMDVAKGRNGAALSMMQIDRAFLSAAGDEAEIDRCEKAMWDHLRCLTGGCAACSKTEQTCIRDLESKWW